MYIYMFYIPYIIRANEERDLDSHVYHEMFYSGMLSRASGVVNGTFLSREWKVLNNIFSLHYYSDILTSCIHVFSVYESM